MGKDERFIRELFKEDASHAYISPEKKEQAVNELLEKCEDAGAAMAVHTAIGKQDMTHVSYLVQVFMQFRYMDKRLYALQFAVLLAAACVNSALGKQFAGKNYTEEAMCVCAIFSTVLFSTISAIACNIGDKYGIAELAGSCFFNHRQVCVLRMALSGAAGFVYMAILLCVVQPYMRKPVWQTGLYMLVPYFVTGCVQFALIGIESFRSNSYVLWAGGLIMGAVFGFISSFKEIYEESALCVWGLALVLSAALMAAELAVVLHRIERGEMLCMS